MPFRRPCLSCWRSPCIDESPRCLKTQRSAVPGHEVIGLAGALQRKSGLNLCTVEALLRTTTPVFEFFLAMPDAFGLRLRTHLAERSTPLPINRCEKSYSAALLTQNLYSKQSPSPDHCAEPWSDRAAEVRFALMQASQVRGRFVSARFKAGTTIRPINSPGPHVRCTKTSPQQTDPPAAQA